MPVNTPHPQYAASLPVWQRARDVLAGEDAIKAGGEKHLPRLFDQKDDEYVAYKSRASFFNATARTAEGYVGLVFRRPPFVKLPDRESPIGKALAALENDCDMYGTPLATYAKTVLAEVIGVGRCGTLIDWEGEAEQRAYMSMYSAENILNWRIERVNGRNLLTLLVLSELASGAASAADEFDVRPQEQIRVLKLVPRSGSAAKTRRAYECRVELYQKRVGGGSDKAEWQLVESRTPHRRGRSLPLIPFVLHGPRNFQPDIEKLPLADVISLNLDHYRLDADYKHGMHFTALPTPWTTGFTEDAQLTLGSSKAWMGPPGAKAGFLEYTGQGLGSFERALDRDERLLAVLGARLLEGQKRVGETAQAIELRQSGENSILASLCTSLSASLTHVLRWCYWWNSTEELPDEVSGDQVLLELNTDFSTKGLSAPEIQAVVGAWQAGAISRETMFDLFRRGEVVPEGRTLEEETQQTKAERSVER